MSAAEPQDAVHPGSWSASLAIGLLALLARVLHLMSVTRLPTFESYIMDEAYQHSWALSIASGDLIGSEVFFRAPLHACLIAAVYAVAGTGGIAPRLLQITLGVGSVIILHRIALSLADRPTAHTAATLSAL